jgi:hypothetical protein
LTAEEYYEYSEHYFNVLLAELEKSQEEGSDVEAEYSVCIPVAFTQIFLPDMFSIFISPIPSLSSFYHITDS